MLPGSGIPSSKDTNYWAASFVYLRGGRLAEVPSLVDAHERIARTLSPHDAVHSVAVRAVFASVAGDWQALADLTGRAEAGCGGQEDTPCQFNWRTLLVCGLGHAHLGNRAAARRLEDRPVGG